MLAAFVVHRHHSGQDCWLSFVSLEVCMMSSDAWEASPLEVDFHVILTQRPFDRVFKVPDVYSNGNLLSISGNQQWQ